MLRDGTSPERYLALEHRVNRLVYLAIFPLLFLQALVATAASRHLAMHRDEEVSRKSAFREAVEDARTTIALAFLD